LYTIGRIATIPCGGADIESRESRFINEATKAAGRYLPLVTNLAKVRGRKEEVRKPKKSSEISSVE